MFGWLNRRRRVAPAENRASWVRVTEAEAEQVLSDPKRGAYACRCNEIDRAVAAIDEVLAAEAEAQQYQ